MKEIVQIYCACIRPLLEYAAPVFHDVLSGEIERVQKRCLKIIFPDMSYDDALELTHLPTLFERRSNACKKLFLNAYTDVEHKLNKLIPFENKCDYSLRSRNKFLGGVYMEAS